MDPQPPAAPLPESRCPLCGGPNGCVPAATGGFDSPCWCRDVTFAPGLLAKVPADQAGRACVCRKCAQSEA